ncbi:MAG: hypothetical protein Q4B29_00235 [Candidatus Saccharibacteria bacterium]|nr:hypothetical protein [Candidatus Saccharibacteria bacterium]
MQNFVDRIQAHVAKLAAPNLVRLFLKALIATASTAAGVGILFILIGEWGEVQGKIMVSTLVAIGLCLPSLLFARVFEDKEKRLFALLGFLFTAFMGINFLLSIWGGQRLNDLALFTGFILVAAGCCFSLISDRARKNQNKSLIVFGDLGILYCLVMSFYSVIAIFDIDNFALMTTIPIMTILAPLTTSIPVGIYLSLEKIPQLKIPARAAVVVTILSSALVYVTQVIDINLIAAFEDSICNGIVCAMVEYSTPLILIRLNYLAGMLSFIMIPILLTEYLSNRSDRRIYRLIAISALLISTGVMSIAILIGDFGKTIVAQLLGSSIVVISLIFFLSLFLRIKPLDAKINKFLWVTVGAATGLSLNTILLFFADQNLPGFFVRLLIVLWILTVLGTITVPIMNRIARSKLPTTAVQTKKKLPVWAIVLIILFALPFAFSLIYLVLLLAIFAPYR